MRGPRSRSLLSSALLVLLFGLGVSARAADHQILLRTGAVNALIGGVKGIDPFTTAPVIDGEFEFLHDSKKSRLVHITFAQEMKTAQTKYYYTGYGERFYLFGTSGKSIDSIDNSGLVQIRGTRRYFIDWEFGLGQLQARTINLSLNLTSTVIEAGGAAGMMLSLGKNWGLVIQAGAGYAYGISSVTVSGAILRALLGVTYYL